MQVVPSRAPEIIESSATSLSVSWSVFVIPAAAGIQVLSYDWIPARGSYGHLGRNDGKDSISLIAIKNSFPPPRFTRQVQIVQAVQNVQIVSEVAGADSGEG
jgi:hypothetical protein